MLQKKRNELRKQIRKSHMEKIFLQKRKQFAQQFQMEQPGTLQYFAQVTNILINIRRSIKKDTNQYRDLLILFSNQSSKNSMLNTKYLNQKLNCNIFCQIMSKTIQNLGYQDSEDEKDQKQIPQLQMQPQIFIIYHFLVFINETELIFLNNQIIIKLIQCVWLLLSSNILFQQIEDYSILRRYLIFVQNVLKIHSNQLMSALQSKGIGSTIVSIIKYMSSLKVPLDVHQIICHIIDSYVSFKKCDVIDPHHKVVQMYITTEGSRQKQQLLAYCLNILVKKQRSLYKSCLSSIRNILALHQYLVQHIKIQHIKVAVQMVLQKDRQIQNQALYFVQDIIYFSKQSTDELLHQNWILDIIQNRLIIQQSTNDTFVVENVERCAFIICNLTLTEDRKQIQSIFKHSIWSLIYENLNTSSKLFPLIMTMEYFFERIDRKKAVLFLDPYFQAIRQLDLSMCGEYQKNIKNTIIVLYKKSKFWPQDECQKFRDVIARNNLRDYLEIQMDLQI